LYICSTAFLIMTWLRWSCSCVPFKIESTRWRCRSSSICSRRW
jgi:nitrate reductase gamma subunit